MSDFPGILTITSDDQSFLDNSKLLLKSDVSGSAQAALAATSFLQTKHFGTGSPIVVHGKTGKPLGGVPTIRMDDASVGDAVEAAETLVKKKGAAAETPHSTRKKKTDRAGEKNRKTKKTRPEVSRNEADDKKK